MDYIEDAKLVVEGRAAMSERRSHHIEIYLFGNFFAGFIVELGNSHALGGLSMLALDSKLDGIKNIIAYLPGWIARDSTILVDSSLNQNREPIILRGLVEFICTTDVGLRSIADEIHGRWWLVDGARVLSPLLQKPGGKCISSELRLAEGDCVQIFAGDSRVNGLERSA